VLKIRLLVAAVAACLAALAGAAGNEATAGGSLEGLPGAARLAAAAPEEGRLMAVATFDAAPTASQVSALRALGLDAQGLEHLPLALVRGTKAQLLDAAATGVARDVYPDDRMELFWDVSNRTIKADTAQALGYTGKSVQVAVVDSGIDGTHPDLADHVTHNVKLVGPEYANLPPSTPPGTLVLPIDEGPYKNTDLGSGHGTHVAGIIAADGHTSPSQVGVAPDAELIGYSIGEVIATTAVISAFEHILAHPEWGIDVVNNSWGNSFMLYDPAHPVNRATKAVADTGVTVVFAAGNAGDTETEATLNPFSMPPWVISVASSTVSAERSDFSSNGLQMDNSVPTAADANGHVRFVGDGLGMYHPDVAAPGTSITSSATPTGAAVRASTPGGPTAVASGTSMATPHVSGVAALLLQAKPGLAPQRLREVLEASAAPMADGSPFWQTGYGLVDVPAAITLARAKDPNGKKLVREHSLDDQRFLASRAWSVLSSDLWTWAAATATVEGVPDSRAFTLAVPAGTEGVKATVAYPSAHAVGVNAGDYQITVRDANGQVVGTSTSSPTAGASTVLVDLRDASVAYGNWTFEVAGLLDVSDPDTIDSESVLGRMVTLQAALLKAQAEAAPPAGPTFVADGTAAYSFVPDGATALPTPEGCLAEAGTPEGGLGTLPLGGPCHSGQMGYLLNRLAGIPAVFTSAPLAQGMTLGGRATATVHLADTLSPVYGAVFTPLLVYIVEEIDSAGNVWTVGTGDSVGTVGDGRNVVTFDLPPTDVAAGSRLRVKLQYTASPAGAPSSTARMLYGGAAYGDSGVTFTFGHLA
jgi:serine protease AprX